MSLLRAPRRFRLHPRRHRRGQGLVEFALVLPIIVFVIIAAIDAGRAVVAYNTLVSAARHGSRVAAVNQLAPADTVTSCREDMPIERIDEPHWSARACTAFYAFGLNVRPGDVALTYRPPATNTVTCATGALHIGCIARIEVSAVWTPVTPVLGSLIGPVTFNANSEQPVERVFP